MSPKNSNHTAPGQPLRLAWRAVVAWADVEGRYLDRIYLDAANGELLARHGLVQDGLYRKIYTANQSSTVPGTLVFEEGGTSSDAIATAALEATYQQ